MNQEKAYILGVIGPGDGFVKVKKGEAYILGLNTIDKDFADEFERCLNLVYKKKCRRYFYPPLSKWGKKNIYVTLLCSKEAVYDILEYKGMRAVQHHLVNEINKINEGKLDKREIETIVMGITNTTRIMDPGSNPNFVKGDVARLTAVEYYNNHNIKEEEIENAEGDTLNRDYSTYKKGEVITKKVADELSKKYDKVFIKMSSIQRF